MIIDEPIQTNMTKKYETLYKKINQLNANNKQQEKRSLQQQSMN
jgi:hypothetical protein